MATIDLSGTSTVEVGYDELCGALAARDLQALWSMQTALMPTTPLPATKPWLWKWDTIYPLAKRAGEIVTIERGGDRRVLALANPGLNGLPFTTTTLWGAIQYLGAGEAAPAHRHTPCAIRFVIAGSGVYTTVDGDACQMEAGDLILTPKLQWHDHNNHGDAPMVWFDGLDLPLVNTLESIFFENHPDETLQEVRGHNLSERALAEGRTGDLEGGGGVYSPLLRYSWTSTDKHLSEQLASGADEATMEYLNPLTGAPAIPTFASSMTRIRAGYRTPTRRRTGSAVYLAFRGSGSSIVAGERFDWGPGDVFAVPSWAPLDHEAHEDADLFFIDDSPVLRALNLYNEETEPEHQEATRTFEPR